MSHKMTSRDPRPLFGCAVAVLLGLGLTPPALAQGQGRQPVALTARLLLSNQLLDSASRVVDAALKTDSANPGLLMIKAEILGKQSRRSEQIAVLRSVLAGQPGDWKANEELARIYCDSGLVDSADRFLALPAREDTLNPEVSYLLGRLHERKGELNLAIQMFRRCEGMLESAELVHLPLGPNDQMPISRLSTLDGKSFLLSPGQSTIILFWATWSRDSYNALKAILGRLPAAGISWRFLPINVDDWRWRKIQHSSIAAKLQEAGYTGPGLLDSGLILFDRVGVLEVPTIIATNFAGDIDIVGRGWSADVRSRVVGGLLDGLRDLTSRPRASPESKPDTACERSRRLVSAARVLWDGGNFGRGRDQAARAAAICSANVLARVQLASWYWQWGDSLHSREQADQAILADSANPWAWYTVAQFARFTGANERAGEALRYSLARDSDFTPAWGALGRLSMSAGDTVTVRKAADALTRLNRHSTDLAILRADLSEARGSYQDAVTAWRKILDDRFR